MQLNTQAIQKIGRKRGNLVFNPVFICGNTGVDIPEFSGDLGCVRITGPEDQVWDPGLTAGPASA